MLFLSEYIWHKGKCSTLLCKEVNSRFGAEQTPAMPSMNLKCKNVNKLAKGNIFVLKNSSKNHSSYP
jgi:hypothetical protein